MHINVVTFTHTNTECQGRAILQVSEPNFRTLLMHLTEFCVNSNDVLLIFNHLHNDPMCIIARPEHDNLVLGTQCCIVDPILIRNVSNDVSYQVPYEMRFL